MTPTEKKVYDRLCKKYGTKRVFYRRFQITPEQLENNGGHVPIPLGSFNPTFSVMLPKQLHILAGLVSAQQHKAMLACEKEFGQWMTFREM